MALQKSPNKNLALLETTSTGARNQCTCEKNWINLCAWCENTENRNKLDAKNQRDKMKAFREAQQAAKVHRAIDAFENIALNGDGRPLELNMELKKNQKEKKMRKKAQNGEIEGSGNLIAQNGQLAVKGADEDHRASDSDDEVREKIVFKHGQRIVEL